MSIVKGTKEFDKAPTVNGADVLSTNSVVDALSDVDTTTAAPSVGDSLEWDGTNWVPASSTADPTSNIAEATAEITTTSATYVLASSMTLTPASGTYLVWFSGVCRTNSAGNQVRTSIYSGGTLVAASAREYAEDGGDGAGTPGYATFTCMAKVTVNGSEAIEGKFNRSTGTGYLRERQLTILKVA